MMYLYFKAVKAYTQAVFRPDEEERKDTYKSNVIKRYGYYTIDDLMIVNDSTGKYVRRSMPKPFSILGKIYWKILHIWQIKIAKTHGE
jgi:hypothetical protein